MILTLTLSLTAFAQSQAPGPADPLRDWSVSESQVNTFTFNRQQDQAIAAGPAGDLLVVWGSRRQEGGTFGIFAQHLDPLGRPLGTELHVNAFMPGHQVRPTVAMAADGSAWVAWMSSDQDGPHAGIRARRMERKEGPAGQTTLVPVGEEIRVHEASTLGNQMDPVLTINDQGEVLFAWLDYSTELGTLRARAFQLDGKPKGPSFVLAENQGNRQSHPSIGSLAEGQFVATWASSDAEDGRSAAIRAPFLTAAGTSGDVFSVDDHLTERGIEPCLTTNGQDRFAVAWMSTHLGMGYEAMFRTFDANGKAQGPSQPCEAGGTGSKSGATVVLAPDGRILVAYNVTDQKESRPGHRPVVPTDIRGRFYDANGVPQGEGFCLNQNQVGEQTLLVAKTTPHALWTAHDQIALVWHGTVNDLEKRGVGLTLLTRPNWRVAAPQEFEPVAALADISDDVMAEIVRPDRDPNWRPQPFQSNAPRGGTGGFTMFNSTGWVPPDPNFAVGTTHIVGVVNSTVKFYTKTGSQTYSRTLQNFFSSVGAGSFVFDPLAVYDPHSDRYIIAAAEDTNNTSYLVLGISDDGDPNGTWHTYRWTASSCGFLDFPDLGVDDQAIYISGDCFSGGGNDVYIVDKSSILNGGSIVTKKVDMSGSLLSLGCMKDYDVGTNVQYFASTWDVNSSQISIHAINDPLGSATKSRHVLSVSSYSSPPNADQKGTSNKADTIDNRIKHGVVRNGHLWTTFNIGAGSPKTARVRWVEVDLRGWPNSGNTPTLVQEGTVNLGAGEHNWFGDIHVDNQGNAALAFNRSSTSQYISVEYTLHMASDPAGFMSAPTLLQASTSPETGSRWGDYSQVEQDPVDPAKFWSHHEYRTNNWKTWCGEFTIRDSIVLSSTDLIRGFPATMTLDSAQPSELVYFVWSAAGTGSGPCFSALGGLCLDLLAPLNLAGTRLADATGTATFTKTVPNSAPTIPIHLQAVVQRGVGGADSLKSNVVSKTIL